MSPAIERQATCVATSPWGLQFVLQRSTGTLFAKRQTMGFLVRFAGLALVLFALPAHAQSTGKLASPTSAAGQVAQPAVNATPSVNSAPRQDRATLEPAGAPQVPPVPPPPVVPAESTPYEHTSWYGSQTLLTDATAFSLLLSATIPLSNNNDGLGEALAYASLGTYVMGGPIVHAVHGNWGRAFGSLGLRIAAPILGALLVAPMERCSGGDCIGGEVVGFALGAGTAIALDAAVIARETVSAGPAVLPVATTGKDGTWLGLSGRF